MVSFVTREQIIVDYKNLCHKLGRLASTKDVHAAFKRGEIASPDNIRTKFTLRELQGLTQFSKTGKRHFDNFEQITTAVRSLAQELGHSPSEIEFKAAQAAGAIPSTSVLKRYSCTELKRLLRLSHLPPSSTPYVAKAPEEDRTETVLQQPWQTAAL